MRIATCNRARILVERTIPSVLAQMYRIFEIVIVGDHRTDDMEERVRALGDPRITFENLPSRPEYPRCREYFWMTAGTRYGFIDRVVGVHHLEQTSIGRDALE